MNPRSFNYDPFYVPVRIKLDVSKPAKDKIFHSVPNMGNMIIWLHYEKVKRICTYCARYFHNAEHCPERIRRIMVAGGSQGFDRYGNWMAQWSRIPMHLVQNQITSFQGLSVPPSQALNTLRQVFAGIKMGGSSIQNTRTIRAPDVIISGGNLPPTNIAEGTHPTQGTENQDTMMLDQQEAQPNKNIQEIMPVSSNATHTTVQTSPITAQQMQGTLNTNIQ